MSRSPGSWRPPVSPVGSGRCSSRRRRTVQLERTRRAQTGIPRVLDHCGKADDAESRGAALRRIRCVCWPGRRSRRAWLAGAACGTERRGAARRSATSGFYAWPPLALAVVAGLCHRRMRVRGSGDWLITQARPAPAVARRLGPALVALGLACCRKASSACWPRSVALRPVWSGQHWWLVAAAIANVVLGIAIYLRWLLITPCARPGASVPLLLARCFGGGQLTQVLGETSPSATVPR